MDSRRIWVYFISTIVVLECIVYGRLSYWECIIYGPIDKINEIKLLAYKLSCFASRLPFTFVLFNTKSNVSIVP